MHTNLGWRTKLKTFVGNGPATREPTAIIGSTREEIRVVHDFTTDTSALLAAFEEASGKAHATTDSGKSAATTPVPRQQKAPQVLGVLSCVEAESMQMCDIDRLSQSLEGLEVMAQSLSGIPPQEPVVADQQLPIYRPQRSGKVSFAGISSPQQSEHRGA